MDDPSFICLEMDETITKWKNNKKTASNDTSLSKCKAKKAITQHLMCSLKCDDLTV